MIQHDRVSGTRFVTFWAFIPSLTLDTNYTSFPPFPLFPLSPFFSPTCWYEKPSVSSVAFDPWPVIHILRLVAKVIWVTKHLKGEHSPLVNLMLYVRELQYEQFLYTITQVISSIRVISSVAVRKCISAPLLLCRLPHVYSVSRERSREASAPQCYLWRLL